MAPGKMTEQEIRQMGDLVRSLPDDSNPPDFAALVMADIERLQAGESVRGITCPKAQSPSTEKARHATC